VISLENEKRLKQIDWSIIGIIIIIFLLIHSIYLLINEKKGLLGQESLSNEEFLVQAIINRVIASAVILMFFTFNTTNLKDLIESNDATEEEIKNQELRVIVSGLALLAVLIEIYLNVKNYITLKEQEINDEQIN